MIDREPRSLSPWDEVSSTSPTATRKPLVWTPMGLSSYPLTRSILGSGVTASESTSTDLRATDASTATPDHLRPASSTIQTASATDPQENQPNQDWPDLLSKECPGQAIHHMESTTDCPPVWSWTFHRLLDLSSASRLRRIHTGC